MQQHLIVFGDIHGDFDALVYLLTKVCKVAFLESERWVWAARDLTLVCLGDFIDRYRVDNEFVVSSEQAMRDEERILDCFQQLQQQARAAENCAFVVCVGNHELGNLLEIRDYFAFGVRDPQSAVDVSRRTEFLRDKLLPFVRACPVLVRWGNFFLCHGGLEWSWFERNAIESIEDVNNRFWQAIGEKNVRQLFRFMEDDSPLLSRKMALSVGAWRAEDKSRVAFLLAPQILNPKFVVGHTTIAQIREESLGSFHSPECDPQSTTTLLASAGTAGDDAFFVDVGMSRGFWPKNAALAQLMLHKPQCMMFVAELDANLDVLFDSCRTLG